jgi:SHS2 domain-containing protein
VGKWDDVRVVGSGRGHRVVAHTADVILEAWGPDLAVCCEEAVTALAATYVETAGTVVAGRRRVHLSAAPEESLLLAVLEELIFTLDTAEEVPVRAEVSSTADGGLDVVLVLADPDRVIGTGAVPKAVSRSELAVESRPGSTRCRFLVDV